METEFGNIDTTFLESTQQTNPFMRFKDKPISKDDLILIMHTYKMDPYDKQMRSDA